MAIKYKWLVEQLTKRIRSSIKKGINKLPGEEQLASEYHVSRQTVRQALSILSSDGLIEKRHGSGSYITGYLPADGENRIAILITNAEDYLYPALLFDIKKELSEHHFLTETFVTDNSIATERLQLEKISKGHFRGIIAEGSKSALPNPNLDLYRKITTAGVPIVFLHNHYEELSGIPAIIDANYEGSAMLVRHLVTQGHRTIACIFQVDEFQGKERFRGYLETLREQSCPIDDTFIYWFDAFDLIGLEQRDDVLFLHKIAKEIAGSCTAVICHNDEIAHRLAVECRQLGLHLPEDMAIASFDNTYLSNSGTIPLTTLAHEPHQMAHLTAQAILSKCKGLPVESQTVPWTLLTRRST